MGATLYSEDCQSSWDGFGLCDPEPRSASVAKGACSGFISPLRRDVNSSSPILVSLKAYEQHKGEDTTWGTGSHRVFGCTSLHLIHYYSG